MQANFRFWLLAILASAAVAWALAASAQQTTTPPATPDAEAAAPSESDPGDAAAPAGEQSEQQRRRRFQTTTAAQLKIGDKSISLTAGILKSDSPDYASIANAKEGEVVLLARTQVFKLKTDLPLEFDGLTVKTENVATGYPGVYGVWLRKTANGWNLVFNERPDVWGTMYDPAADVGEVAATYTKLSEPTDALKFEIPQDGQGGTLKISWGEHQWTAPFRLAS